MLTLRNIQKTYQMGDTLVYALNNVSLEIEAGDFVAIMGPSGSGKSTLMNVLGLLDVPDKGSYELNGKEVSHLTEDELAILRRDSVGFIFQQFNLLPRTSAAENVSLPLLYSQGQLDLNLAQSILEKVGLGSRASHKPNELSGGQQQRVAIARSMINQPKIIFADEPTGNLDSVSEKEIMTLLKNLNEQGITIILVTHEDEIGKKAKRLIRMRDGTIQSDERLDKNIVKFQDPPKKASRKNSNFFSDLSSYLKQGIKTLASNKIRTGLSMLGILIGVAAVVAMLALGNGAQKAIEKQLSSLGSNLLVLRTGAIRVGGVSLDSGSVTKLTLEDAIEIKEKISSIVDTSPSVTGRGQVTFKDKNWSTQIIGASSSYARMRAASPEIGRFFTNDDNTQRRRVALLGMTVLRQIFGEQNPIGEMIKINKVSFQVIGILPEKGASTFRDQDDVIVIPILTAMNRLLGKDYVDSIDIEVAESQDMDLVENDILRFMYNRRKVPFSQQQDAFQIRNMADIKAAMTESSRTMSLLLSCIATISLLVGGIGIMNIMLVSVTERTREIGLRKAIGAKKQDILTQFLVEAMVVSVVGGLLGIATGWGITLLLSILSGWTTSISFNSIFLAFFFSATIGIAFGIYPARKASRLHPIEALRHE